MNQNRKKIAKDHIKQNRVIAIPNIIACLAFEKLASYNFCENVTYRTVSLVGMESPSRDGIQPKKVMFVQSKFNCVYFFSNSAFPHLYRSSHQRCSVRKVVLRDFTKSTGEHQCQRPATLLKMRLWHRCFSVNFTKLLKTHFFAERLWETASICITEGSNNITVNNNQSTPTEGRIKQGDQEGVPLPFCRYFDKMCR